MDDVFVYLVELPSNVNEVVTPCNDGYTIYINQNLCEEAQHDAFCHAMRHIRRNDYEKLNVQMIEFNAHEKTHI